MNILLKNYLINFNLLIIDIHIQLNWFEKEAIPYSAYCLAEENWSTQIILNVLSESPIISERGLQYKCSIFIDVKKS